MPSSSSNTGGEETLGGVLLLLNLYCSIHNNVPVIPSAFSINTGYILLGIMQAQQWIS